MIIKAKTHVASVAQHLRHLAEIINRTIDGGLNSTGSVTLTNSQTTTVVADFHCGADSKIFFTARTSDAATENIYVSSIGDETFTITHSNDTTTRTFDYLVIG